MSTNGTGMRPAAADHSEKRSTNLDACSSRSASAIPVATGLAALSCGSLLSAFQDPPVSSAIAGPFPVTVSRAQPYHGHSLITGTAFAFHSADLDQAA